MNLTIAQQLKEKKTWTKRKHLFSENYFRMKRNLFQFECLNQFFSRGNLWWKRQTELTKNFKRQKLNANKQFIQLKSFLASFGVLFPISLFSIHLYLRPFSLRGNVCFILFFQFYTTYLFCTISLCFFLLLNVKNNHVKNNLKFKSFITTRSYVILFKIYTS